MEALFNAKKEAEYWNEEFKRCYGYTPNLQEGDLVSKVHAVQSAVQRYYVNELKKVLDRE